jgi:cytidylate kinase
MDPYSLGFGNAGYEMPINEKVFLAAFDTIKKLADEGPCVIVGRCADYALRDYPNRLNVFIKAPLEFKKTRIRDEYHIPEERIRGHAAHMDKQRASYYNYYTSRKWGEAASYDLCIDSGLFGIEGTVDLIKHAVDLMENKKEN